jgi:hypothetical protein
MSGTEHHAADREDSTLTDVAPSPLTDVATLILHMQPVNQAQIQIQTPPCSTPKP